MTAPIATPEVKAPPPPRAEAPATPVGPSREVQQFGQMAQEGLKSNRKTESLAAIAGWGVMGRVNLRLEAVTKGVYDLVEKGKLSKEDALPYFERIAQLSQSVDERLEPGIAGLDAAIQEEGEKGTVSPFMRDLNYHYVKAEIKALEQIDDPEAKIEAEGLKKDLAEAEKSREGMNPEEDEIVKMALRFRGEKKLPDKFKDSPLEAIDDFFDRHLKSITRNEKTRAHMAKKLGIGVDELTTLVKVYEEGKAIDAELRGLEGQVFGKTESKFKSVAQKGAAAGGIIGALMAMQVYFAMKKEESGGNPQMG